MNRSSNATYATPGWRGTDPDGGTWVRLTRRSGHPWLEITATGGLHFRTQEEAEAAGLVRLIPAVGYHYDERGEDVVPDVEAAPAPLDPGNPEHLRQVVSLIDALPLPGLHNHALLAVTRSLRDEADRLDREHAEAEKEKADRELAIAKFTEAIPGFDPDSEYGMRVVDAALTVLRERQEAGQ